MPQPKPIFVIEDSRLNMIGSIKNWNKVLYTDVAELGMSYEDAKRKYDYDSYMNWGKKRFDKVYDGTYEKQQKTNSNRILMIVFGCIVLVLIFLIIFHYKK